MITLLPEKVRIWVLSILGVLAFVGFAMDMCKRAGVKLPFEKEVSKVRRAVRDVNGDIAYENLELPETPKEHIKQNIIKTIIPKPARPQAKAQPNESFWDFYYEYVRNPEFRRKRNLFEVSELNQLMLDKAMTYGDFVAQDSLPNNWVYIIDYKHNQINLHFTRKNGRWFFKDIVE